VAALSETKILVVDDDPVSRHGLLQTLSGAGFQTDAVDPQGWTGFEPPSLMIIDLECGLAPLFAVRSHPTWREVPVLVLSGSESDNDEVSRALEAGADDFVRKPFQPRELVARIRGQLRVRGYIDELAHKEGDTKIVLELTQTLASSTDLRDILFTVVRRTADVSRVDRCSIVLVQDSGSVGYVAASSDDEQVQDLRVELDKYPEIRQVMTSGTPLVIENAPTHPLLQVVRHDLEKHHVASIAIVPISYEDRPMGVLFLRARQHVEIGEHELSIARTVANATAVALRNARVIKRLRDKTERVTFARFKAERRLRLLKRYEMFLESAADGIMVIDNDGQILFTNARARAISGYTDAELRGLSFDSLVAEQERETVRAIRAGFSRGKYPNNADVRIERRDGVAITLSINFSSVLRQDNAALLSLRDVTRDRHVDAELKKTKEFLERVIDSSANAILSADRDGTVRLFNRASERCFGMAADQVLGKLSIRELFPPEGADDVLRVVAPSQAGSQRPVRMEDHRTFAMSAGGELVPVSVSVAQIFEGGRHEGAVLVFTDLRDKLRMEARLAAAQEELQSREKQALIAELAGAAAHELNQPLTSVMGYAELLKRKLDPGSASLQAAEVIMNEAERMAEIVRKIGKITRYETKSYVGAAKILDLDRSSQEPQRNR
jgi:PAS domain S-box-containing protein